MNPNEDDAVARALSGKDEIVPSSGFAASVMDAVRQDAAAPAPIPFPWKWALPGWAVSVGLLAFFFVRFAHQALHSSSVAVANFSMHDLFSELSQGLVAGAPVRMGIEWGVLALVASLVAVWMSMRLATGGE